MTDLYAVLLARRLTVFQHVPPMPNVLRGGSVVRMVVAPVVFLGCTNARIAWLLDAINQTKFVYLKKLFVNYLLRRANPVFLMVNVVQENVALVNRVQKHVFQNVLMVNVLKEEPVPQTT